MSYSKQKKRVQFLLPQDEYEILQDLAAESDQSVSALVRETVEGYLIEKARAHRVQETVNQLCNMDLPVDDWELVEKQLNRRFEACLPDEWE